MSTAPFANLDVDDVTSFGPETITITNTSPGIYTYFIHQFSSSGSFTTSGAAARIYTSVGLASTVNVPTAGSGRYWYVCQIDGQSKAVTILNFLSNSPPSLPSGPATLLSQPLSRTTTAGSNATFSVIASGSSPITYQWQRDGTNIADATNAVLYLPFVTRASSGALSVTVTNATGGAVSASAFLRVLGTTLLDPLQPQPGGGIRLRFGDLTGYPLTSQLATSFEVQTSTNLATTNWVRLTNALQVINGKIEVDDTAAPLHPRRFYRVIER